ncbi:DUF4232 domain-containing protein [Streptomyces sp. NBC_01754]|uniref:DUF4232 domain-containing protein n=1 Tax=Streptomyces sp. NBC_01754 TaxID=2975930 RepID=UPI002DD98CDE|nr:DUF4232 domain-containing protein [Streptomyces sp. NBC_01754]WSC93102.1 DUF4232 domain-containing protein [Streptomyces sp. NBC_01754]
MRTLHLRRTARTARTGALASATLLAALSLTACQGGGETSADASVPAPTAPSSQQADGTKAPDEQGAQAPGSGAGTDSGSSSDSGPGPAAGSSGGGENGVQPAARQQPGSGGDSDPVTLACDGGNSEVTFEPVSRPLNHALLTVTNTGSKACNAYGYPALRFDEAQSVPPVYKESKPQAVVTLAPGESAYAGVTTSSADGSGTGGYSAKSLRVYFQGRDLSGSTGPGADVSLAEKVYVDSRLTVTYWQSEIDDALLY